jgi:hypothetical protein
MKRLVVALSTLTLLLVAAPASAQTEAETSCLPAGDPWGPLMSFTTMVGNLDYQGPLCLKACRAKFAGCKKVSAAMRKCWDAGNKSQWETFSLKCQLDGIETKKTCKDAAKGALKSDREWVKQQLIQAKENCRLHSNACKNACDA